MFTIKLTGARHLATATLTAAMLMAGPSLAQTMNLLSGGMGNAASHDSIAATMFTDLVRERTDGRIDITHYPGGQLGNGQEEMEGVAVGTQAFFISAGSQASRLVKEFGVIDMAFLFDSPEHLSRFLNSELGQQLNDKLAAEFGVRVLSSDWYGLPRQLMHREKFITSVEDVQGVRVRTASVPMYVQNYLNMGAVPVKVDYGEQYLALSQGVVDMTESAANRILATKLYEVAPYITEAEMMYPQNSVFINEAIWSSLSAEDQKIVQDAANEAGALYSKLSTDAFAQEKEEIIAKGGKFQALPDDAREAFAARNGENIDQMVADGLIPAGWYKQIVALGDGN